MSEEHISKTGYKFKYGKFKLGDEIDDHGDTLPSSYISKSLSLEDSDKLVRKLLIPSEG